MKLSDIGGYTVRPRYRIAAALPKQRPQRIAFCNAIVKRAPWLCGERMEETP